MIASLALFGGVAQAATGNSADQQFVQKAWSINQAEITLGQMAQQKGTTPDVKSFGARMAADHTKGLDDLNAAAQRDGIGVPSALLPQQKQLQDQLSRMSGRQFDEAYMKHMVAGHGAAIAVFTQEIADGSGPALRAYAEQMLPTLESHESAADQGEDELRAHPNPPSGNPPSGK
jgi:putative membrane protein